ncbi:hypothetical protein MRB53_035508 [Persea americana]|uniref:Uncharacterized protein n=1 Tax=Persea americana TaxID=3435 RepID=A0ACC2K4U7_PERAE|nr:hypothetical protein MRB53_035508 [Persea americana]
MILPLYSDLKSRAISILKMSLQMQILQWTVATAFATITPLQSLCSSSLSRPRTVAPSSSTRRPHHHHQQRRAPSSFPLLPPRAELIPFTGGVDNSCKLGIKRKGSGAKSDMTLLRLGLEIIVIEANCLKIFLFFVRILYLHYFGCYIFT